MQMGDDQYGLSEHRRFLARRTHFPANPQPSDPYFAHTHRNIPSLPSYNHEEAAAAATFMVGNGMAIPNSLVRFGHDHNFTASATTISASSPSVASASASASLFGVDMENGGWSYAANSRWPRQETLTLLEIRSKLDSKFKEANQKGPLWDEVSRLMAEEHGYQRSGKKCREKFENLHKYYKKTKEGKAGRQDGRNYRFFRQLEALYGEATTNQNSLSETQTTLFRQPPNSNAMNQENNEEKLMMSESLSFSNASEFDTSSSENNDDQDLSAIAFMMNQSMAEKQRNANERGSSKKGWKAKVKDFVESQMKELMDSQDAWMERMMKKIEEKEQERMSQMEEWRRQESVRFDKEHQFWAKERAWAEARDVALMEFLNKCTETHSLLEEIEAKMYFNKKRKEDFCSSYNNNNYFQQIDSCEAQENNINNDHNIVRERDSHSPSNSYVGTQQLLDTNSFQIGVNAGDQSLWDRCGLNLKLSKGKCKQI